MNKYEKMNFVLERASRYYHNVLKLRQSSGRWSGEVWRCSRFFSLIPASEACGKAYALAKENEGKMFEHRKREPIRGSYMLKADIHGDPFYEFLINEHSMVRIRAKDGEVITAFFWDGVYVD